MPNLVNNKGTTFSVVAKFVVAALTVILLFFGSSIMTAEEKPSTHTHSPSSSEQHKETAKQKKPPLFSSEGKILSALRFWERDKSSSDSAAAKPPSTASHSHSALEQRTETGKPARQAESNFAPVPPPNPYFDSKAEPAEALQHERYDAVSHPPAVDNRVSAQEQPLTTTSYVSYSYDTRDWIESFSPQYKQDIAAVEIPAELQKTASRSSTATSTPAVNMDLPNPHLANDGWDGHAQALMPQQHQGLGGKSGGGQTAVTAASHSVSHPTPAAKPKIDLSPSYRKSLPYVQTYGVVVVQADFPLTEISSILDEINLLQHDLTRYIGVPEPTEKIELCLFKEGESYTRFLEEYFPRAPLDRRALYVKLDRKPGTLMVQKSRNFEIDLRHEMTHAIIHASIPVVPIWLDEGLAKYFEVPAQDRLENNPYMSQVRWNIRLGAIPSLERLVKCETIDDMGAKEYRDSWAWTHFLIHRSPNTHRLLASYLQMLATWSPRPEETKGSRSKISAASQKVKTVFVKEFLGRETSEPIPSIKPYLDGVVSHQRETFKEHFGAAAN